MFKAELFNNYFNQKLSGNWLEICTDSRKYTGQNIFWCLDGPNFKASGFIDEVAKLGCKNFVVNKSAKRDFGQLNIIYVEDSLKSLQDFSTFCIDDFKKSGGIVTALTGSNGKTTNKEILNQILCHIHDERYVSCTKGNYNNHIGVPLTILDFKPESKVVILEMGTNHPGEINTLCEIGLPDHGFITNIGDAHLEFLIDREGVLTEKRALFDHCFKNNPNSTFILNLDDEKLFKLKNEKVITFSNSLESDYKYKISGDEIHVSGKKKFVLKNAHIREEYNQVNLLQCVLFAISLFPEKSEEIINFSSNIKLPENNRSTWLEIDGTRIFLDAYNANPSSMSAALSGFAKNVGDEVGDCLVVLGGMNEIGELCQSKHQEIGQLLSDIGIVNAVFIGRYAKYYQEGFSSGTTFESTDEFKSQWPSALKSHKYIFLKGSRTLQLESLLDIS